MSQIKLSSLTLWVWGILSQQQASGSDRQSWLGKTGHTAEANQGGNSETSWSTKITRETLRSVLIAVHTKEVKEDIYRVYT